jgi:phosphoribosylformylglycinamidine synthase
MMTTASLAKHLEDHSLDKIPYLHFACAVLPHQLQWQKLQAALSFNLYWLAIPKTLTEREEEFLTTLNAIEATLADSVDEQCFFQALEKPEPSNASTHYPAPDTILKEVHSLGSHLKATFFAQKQFRPGVTDNPGKAIAQAFAIKGLPATVKIASGTGYLFADENYEPEYNNLVEKLALTKLEKIAPEFFLTFPERAGHEKPEIELIDLNLDNDALVKLSKERCLSLSLEEMQAVVAYFNDKKVLAQRHNKGLSPVANDIELEIIAQTWSEHCKHKIFTAEISYEGFSDIENGKGKVEKIDSLYKTYIKGLTNKLAEKRPDLLSVFEDNAGIVDFSEHYAVCMKVETHNSPSALEPYGGALTGILGVNRDIMGTGLGAKPIFNTDVLCFVHPDAQIVQTANSPNLLAPLKIMNGVRKGIEDGGNKSGIPNVNGAVFFHDSYRAKPLVYCGTGGLLQKQVAGIDATIKHTKIGDAIVMAGGRVGRDGVHGATFSSLALDETASTDVVQIGDPFTQKRLLDFILKAQEMGLITGITDNGAGGLSSSVGEMAQITNGATINLDAIPLKYPGLSDWQIVVSESQERMTISTDNYEALAELAGNYDVELSNIGTFHNHGYFEIKREETLALLDLDFLHKGAPRLQLTAGYRKSKLENLQEKAAEDLITASQAIRLLGHPNIASRESVVRRFDHEVQGQSVVKAFMGEAGKAPCDAAVLAPLANLENTPFVVDAQEANLGLSVSCGMAAQLSNLDAYLMAQLAVDEAVRNLVAVGTNPATICLLDNFCWPDPVQSPHNLEGAYKLGQLVEACRGLYDIGLVYGTPLISGKDSMKNNFKDGDLDLAVIPTLLISGMGKLPDITKALTSDFKTVGDLIYIVCAGLPGLAATAWAQIEGITENLSPLPYLNIKQATELYSKVFEAAQKQLLESCHDLSDGGLFVAATESAIGGNLGANLKLPENLYKTLTQALESDTEKKTTYPIETLERKDLRLYGEAPATLLLSIKPENQSMFEKLFADLAYEKIGTVKAEPELTIIENETTLLELKLSILAKAQESPLPFN